MGKTRKMNPFMKFMTTFRKQNKGKYDFKQMGREGGKEWRKVKGGGKPQKKLEICVKQTGRAKVT